ncbi:galactokinase [Gordonia amarae]|uniref:Galactokinase n=2 Tax=Gordonia amarae TaxID=36821 RepID=G7GTJ9_9ACTN|nr:galactokinase [Gordonia amarae]MCS3877847.1 galactokinase [Gordonia amarae]QHN21098.1 galactokinase [Gordonia amarae]QHN29950.1 galactokinase [Gordonia amarae]QHN38725.1 galactokinase [Gordonia amarae]GAB06924.1 galactokinase [Gordonia amarae NBRC 15530]
MSTIRAFAPGRLNLIGEHTDYNRGYALPIALTVGSTAEFDRDPAADTLTVTSDSRDGQVEIGLSTTPGEITGWASYIAGCVWALRRSGRPAPGGRMRIRSDVPVGAGLSSSAALECAVLLALTAGAQVNRHDLAVLAHQAENDYVGTPTGLLDQLASLHGQPDTAMLIDFDSLTVDAVRMQLREAELVVIDSNSPHHNSAGDYAARHRSCVAAAAALGVESLRQASAEGWRDVPPGELRKRARHVLTENTRVITAARALADGDLPTLATAMNQSHFSMRYYFEITIPAIDFIVESARLLGATGARMTGGGFGGSVVALVPTGAVDTLTATLPDAVEQAGHPRPTVRTMRAGAGAHLT